MTYPLNIGDVISIKGPSVPKEFEPYFWRVRFVDSHGKVDLDGPYHDEVCTQLVQIITWDAQLKVTR